MDECIRANTGALIGHIDWAGQNMIYYTKF